MTGMVTLADPDVPKDSAEYARILEDFYTLMFSQEGIFGIVAWKQTTFDQEAKAPNAARGRHTSGLMSSGIRTVTPTESQLPLRSGLYGATLPGQAGPEVMDDVVLSLGRGTQRSPAPTRRVP